MFIWSESNYVFILPMPSTLVYNTICVPPFMSLQIQGRYCVFLHLLVLLSTCLPLYSLVPRHREICLWQDKPCAFCD